MKEISAALSTLVMRCLGYICGRFPFFLFFFPYIKLANYISGSSQVLLSDPTLVMLQLTLTSVVKSSCNKVCVVYFSELILCAKRSPGPLQSQVTVAKIQAAT